MILIAEDDVLEGTDNYNDGEIVIASSTADDGVLLTTSDVDGSITLQLFEPGSATALYTTTLSASSVIVNTAIAWRLDSVGRNFRHRVKQTDVGAAVLKGGRRYHFVYSIPTLVDGVLRCVWVWNIRSLHI